MGLVKEAVPVGLEVKGPLLLICPMCAYSCTWDQALLLLWKEALESGPGPNQERPP